ncbi:MAG: outer membrane protein assembly factor BamE [Paracoccaceae bacterium]|tara:strand:- start:230 stop:688 length:459 start_codon:yes stop_codon:yes gene_type:complete
MNEKKKIKFKTLVILLLFITPFGCSKIVEQNGVPTNDEIFKKLSTGKSTKSQVKKILGEPLLIDNQLVETWIYFSQKIEKFAFFEPKLSSRKVILLSFKNSILTKKETFSQRDTKIIEISTKKVISGGRKLTVLQQIFGNIGNFSSQKFQQD